MGNAEAISWWRAADILTMDTATIQAILDLQKSYYMQWGKWPTAQEIQKQLVGS